MKKIIIIFVLFLSITLIISGCDTGSNGTGDSTTREAYNLAVRTTDDEEAISSVKIKVSGPDISDETIGETDTDGVLQLTSLKGEVNIEAAHADYDFLTLTVDKSDADKTIDMNCRPYVALEVEITELGPSTMFTVRVEEASQIDKAALFDIREYTENSVKSFGEEITKNVDADIAKMNLFILGQQDNQLLVLELSEETLGMEFSEDSTFSGNLSTAAEVTAYRDKPVNIEAGKLVLGNTNVYRVELDVDEDMEKAAGFALINSEGKMGPISPLGSKAGIYDMQDDGITLVLLDDEENILAAKLLKDDLVAEKIRLTADTEIAYTKLPFYSEDLSMRNLLTETKNNILASARLYYPEDGEYRTWIPLLSGEFVGFPEGFFMMGDTVLEFDFAFDNRDLFNHILDEKLAEVNYNLAELELFLRVPGLTMRNAKTGESLTAEEAQQAITTINFIYDADNPQGHSIDVAMADVEVIGMPHGSLNVFRVTVFEVIGIKGVEGFTIFEAGEEDYSQASLGQQQNRDTAEDFVNLYILGVLDQPGTGSVSGRVNFMDREEHSGITVTAAGDNVEKTVTTDSSGDFAFTGLPAANLIIEASYEEYYSTNYQIQVQEGENVEITEVLKLYPLDEYGSIEGHARYIDKTNHEGITINVRTQKGEELPNLITSTNSEGYFSFKQVPVDAFTGESNYIFTAQAIDEEEYATDSVETKVSAGELNSTDDLWLRPRAQQVKIFADDTNPWNSDALFEMLEILDVNYEIYDSNDMDTIPLNIDSTVWIINDQPQTFYDAYAENQEKFDQFVKDGGTLLFEACDEGWAGGSIKGAGASLPGGVINELRYFDNNTNVNPTHPMMTGVPIELKGTHASHNYFVDLPPGATILTEDPNGSPTLVEYKYHQGRVVATGQPLEFNWKNEQNLRQIYANMIFYTFNKEIEILFPEDQHVKTNAREKIRSSSEAK